MNFKKFIVCLPKHVNELKVHPNGYIYIYGCCYNKDIFVTLKNNSYMYLDDFFKLNIFYLPSPEGVVHHLQSDSHRHRLQDVISTPSESLHIVWAFTTHSRRHRKSKCFNSAISASDFLQVQRLEIHYFF